MVKSDFVEGKDHEHMWSVVYKYAGGKFTGIFADSAIVLKNLKIGAPVLINQKDVEDWAIYDISVIRTWVTSLINIYEVSKKRVNTFRNDFVEGADLSAPFLFRLFS